MVTGGLAYRPPPTHCPRLTLRCFAHPSPVSHDRRRASKTARGSNPQVPPGNTPPQNLTHATRMRYDCTTTTPHTTNPAPPRGEGGPGLWWLPNDRRCVNAIMESCGLGVWVLWCLPGLLVLACCGLLFCVCCFWLSWLLVFSCWPVLSWWYRRTPHTFPRSACCCLLSFCLGWPGSLCSRHDCLFAHLLCFLFACCVCGLPVCGFLVTPSPPLPAQPLLLSWFTLVCLGRLGLLG